MRWLWLARDGATRGTRVGLTFFPARLTLVEWMLPAAVIRVLRSRLGNCQRRLEAAIDRIFPERPQFPTRTSPSVADQRRLHSGLERTGRCGRAKIIARAWPDALQERPRPDPRAAVVLGAENCRWLAASLESQHDARRSWPTARPSGRGQWRSKPHET